MLPKKRKPTHPGEMLLKEFLEPRGISQAEFARHLGWTYARLNEIINGRRGVTASSALTFADAFEMEAEFWMNLQRDWDLWQELENHNHIDPVSEAA